MTSTHQPTQPQTQRTHDQLWAYATLAIAAVAIVVAFTEAYDAAAVIALVGILAGGWSMMISKSITERFETVTGTLLAAVTLAVCLAFGSGIWT